MQMYGALAGRGVNKASPSRQGCASTTPQGAQSPAEGTDSVLRVTTPAEERTALPGPGKWALQTSTELNT